MHAFRGLGSVGLLVLCLAAAPGQSQEKQPLLYPTPFYPLQEGNRWLYEAAVEDAPGKKEVLVTVEKKEIYNYTYLLPDKNSKQEPIWRFQLKVVSGSKELTEHVAVLENGIFRFTVAGKEIAPPLCILKLPVKNGETWKVESTSENIPLTGTFKCEDDTVKVPAGQFPAKHVTSLDFQLGTEKMALEYWFAPNVGIVKQKVRVANSGVVLELKEFKSGK